MKPITATGTITRGKLTIDDRYSLLLEIGKQEDCEVEISIEKLFATRSSKANRYYWLIIGIITEHLKTEWGDATLLKIEIHEWLKGQLNFREIINPETGESTRIARTTRHLNRAKFAAYTENVRQFVFEKMGVVTPDPEPKKSRKHERTT